METQAKKIIHVLHEMYVRYKDNSICSVFAPLIMFLSTDILKYRLKRSG